MDQHTPVLYPHDPHPHVPRKVTVQQATEEAVGFNTAIAIWLTTHVGSMWMAYTFMLLAIVGLLAILGIIPPLVALLVAWLSQTFIQLVLLPVIMVGQNVLSKHGEIQAQETFDTTVKSFHDLEQIMLHLSKQDTELLRQSTMLSRLLPAPEHLHGTHLD